MEVWKTGKTLLKARTDGGNLGKADGHLYQLLN